MKKFLLTFLLFLFCFSGCSFLRGGEDSPLDEDSYTEESGEDSEDMWVDEDEDYAEGEAFSDEEEWDEDEEWSEEEELEESGSKKGGFFSRLFGGGAKANEESAMSEEGAEEDPTDLAKDYDDYEMIDDAGEPDLYVEAPESSQDESSMTDEASSVEASPDEASSIEASPEEGMATADPDEANSTEEGVAMEEAVEASSVEASSVETQPVRKSLNKIIKTPYNKEGVLVNAVYIARANETLNNISQNIYAQDKTAELLRINPHLSQRSLVVGDKIYYNSPNRPTDNSQLLFYYEDNNRSPSYYTVSAGENIRDISYKLLGHAKSWKEIWATNQELESKGTIERNISIAYWPESQAMAQAESLPAEQLSANPTEASPGETSPGEANPMATSPGETNPMATSPGETNPMATKPEEASSGGANPMGTQPETTGNSANNLTEFPPLAENPDLPLLAPSKEKAEKSGFLTKLLSKALSDIEILVIFLLIIGILVFLILTIIKKRKQKDFDYTATNIEA